MYEDVPRREIRCPGCVGTVRVKDDGLDHLARCASCGHIFEVTAQAVAAAASLDGYRLAQLTHRLQSERQANVLYRLDGRPSSVLDLVEENEKGTYVHMNFNMVLEPGLDPFGFDEAPNQGGKTSFAAPPYEDALLGYMPHDLQHLVRYTRSAKALAWLGNDRLAIDDLCMQAELFRMTYHEHMSSPGRYVSSATLRHDRQVVDADPGTGFSFGRGEGWGLDVATAACALSDPAWRDAARPWFDAVVDLVVDGQSACNGFLQSHVHEKYLGGEFHARKAFEQAIVENALTGMRETVYRGASAPHDAMLEDVLVASLYAAVGPMAWGPDENAPWTETAVAPLDPRELPWCGVQLGLDQHSVHVHQTQVYASLAYGHELTGDPLFLARAEQLLGGQLLETLLDDRTENLSNRAALIARAQEFAKP